MATPKQYFHDHLVLLLLSINAFLALAGSIFIIIRLSTSHGNGYIVQYRSSLGINAFKTGGLTDLLAFIVFALLVLGVHAVLSHKVYPVHRQLAISVLYLGILLLALTVVVSNALLALR